MIITVTLNPALDKTVEIDNFAVDKVNRVKSVHIDAGGKGVNVSKVLKNFDVDTKAFGFIGGDTGEELKRRLDELGISHDFTVVDGATRVNTKIFDIIKGTCTDINEVGPMITAGKIEELKATIKKATISMTSKAVSATNVSNNFVILSGSTPADFPTDIYADIISLVSPCKVILDTSGELLKKGVKAKPWLIKPNVEELEELIGKSLNTEADIVNEARKLIDSGIEHIVISAGAKGLYYVGANEAYTATAPKVAVKSTVGAGDSVVAALAIGFTRGKNIKDTLCFATAMGAAAVMEAGTIAPLPDVVATLEAEAISAIT